MAIIGNPRSFHKKWKFVVEIDGVRSSGFQKCSELSVEVAKVEYHEGGALIPNKSPGRLTAHVPSFTLGSRGSPHRRLASSTRVAGACFAMDRPPRRVGSGPGRSEEPYEVPMDIAKSSRHSKVIGEFGEAFLLNWLSRSGFEVTVVDHTGLDIVAYHPETRARLGITVKSRTRNAGKESTTVNLLSYRAGHDDRAKLLSACQAFACEPWLAVYVEYRRARWAAVTSARSVAAVAGAD